MKEDLTDAPTVLQIDQDIIKEEEQKQRLQEELNKKLAQKIKRTSPRKIENDFGRR